MMMMMMMTMTMTMMMMMIDDDDYDNMNTALSSSLAGTLCIEASDDTLQIEDVPASLDDDDETIAVQTTDVEGEYWKINTMTKTVILNTVTELRTCLESKNIRTDGLLKNALVESILLLKKLNEIHQYNHTKE